MPIWSNDATIKRREAELSEHLSQGPPERGSKASPITWLFDAESFAPMARLQGGSAQSIVTDHLGTPVLMVDGAGNKTWSAGISTWGELRGLEGDRFACPFRWPGQYEDAETGLYYNRFRYYDPEAGAYVSQDPIGLLGGIRTFAYVEDATVLGDPFGLTAAQLAGAMAQEGRSLNPAQTAHHIVKENAKGYAEHSRELLSRNGLGVNDAANGAGLWGSSRTQRAQPQHPGRDAARMTGNYHGGRHIHGKANDKLIYQILRNAERRGIDPADILRDIGARMESGDWKRTGGCRG